MEVKMEPSHAPCPYSQGSYKTMREHHTMTKALGNICKFSLHGKINYNKLEDFKD